MALSIDHSGSVEGTYGHCRSSRDGVVNHTTTPTPTPATRVVNAVPPSRSRSESSQVVGSDDDSTDGFSLVDDGGDSLGGSAVLSIAGSSMGNGTSFSTNTAATTSAQQAATAAAREILVPASYYQLQRARWCFWGIWVVATLSVLVSLWVYDSQFHDQSALEDDEDDEPNVPIHVLIGVLVLSTVLALAFEMFDRAVRCRDKALTKEALRTRNIVGSLFPPQFHDRLFATGGGRDDTDRSMREAPEYQQAIQAAHNGGGVEAAQETNGGILGSQSKKQEERHSHQTTSYNSTNDDDDAGRGRRLQNSDNEENDDSEVAVQKPKSFSALSLSRRASNERRKRSSGSSHINSQSNHTTTATMDNNRSNSNNSLRKSRTGSLRSFRRSSGDTTSSQPPPMQRLRSFLTSDKDQVSSNNHPVHSEQSVTLGGDDIMDEPIADLFPDATVMFADISGFTAWSSAREPAQVFKLLETIYRCFDKLAKKRRVFKVETIGDCYVAVTGLPNPQPDHALIMAKFAKECMYKMKELTRQLEVSLGPETADLSMRFGLHSGAVTAGILRGEKSRFQLFGDTVNFASRMESTGQRNRIQASQMTADLLIMAGKKNWVHPRDDLVNAKGKGQVQTYWVIPRTNYHSSVGAGSNRSLNDSSRSLESVPNVAAERTNSMILLKSRPKKSTVGEKNIRKTSAHSIQKTEAESINTSLSQSRRSLLSSSQHSQIWSSGTRTDEQEYEEYDGFDDGNRHERLIDWNVEILATLLKSIAAQRRAIGGEPLPSRSRGKGRRGGDDDIVLDGHKSQNALDEFTEIIPLAKAAAPDGFKTVDRESIDLPIKVESQLREYVTMIACMYRDNFFHNFEHASHVLMSSQKLLRRVINADKQRSRGDEKNSDYTSVIAADPLIQFAIVLSALIHDVDHTGVPNAQLVKENAHIASLYKNKSIAEQNSLDLAWDLLMSPEYRDLQRAIFANQEELERFRQLVVNVVIATDIFDPDMIRVRNSRWGKAFGEEIVDDSPLSTRDGKSLKATIVIEYIMQASDVSHTMQHWQVYQKWNERLFEEMYSAFQVRRGEKDPSIGWYNDELWFFDNYIIPLAKKLKECEVFGAASDECLKYALDNRKEWEANGEEIVRSYVGKHAKPL